MKKTKPPFRRGGRLAIPSGIAVEPLTPGIAGFVYSRSGLGAMQGLTVAQGVGVIDPDYRGEITVVLLNTSGEERRLRRGDRIAQLVFQPALQVELEECETLGAPDAAPGLRTYGKTLDGLHRTRRRTYMSIPATAGQEIPS